jgi:NADPH:quinone reductase-like Zn-dependent oxidoreductase
MPDMRAVAVVSGPQGPTLEGVRVARPQPGPAEVLVRVRSAGVNRTDLRRTQQHHTLAPGERDIAGLEMAGEVVACGAEVRGVAVGERVFGMAKNAYAEYVVIDHRLVLPVPERFDFHQAAAIATVYPTAHDALLTNGRMARGDTVLVQAAASAVGLATIDIASVLGAGQVLGTVDREALVPLLRARGLHHALAARAADLAPRVLEATGGRGADVIVDMVGRGVLRANVECAALRGRIVSVGRLGGFTDEIDLDQLALKRLTLVGVTFRTRSLDEKRALLQVFRDDVYPHFESGRIAPLVDRVFALDDALQAQEYMARNAHFGKILLEP